MPEQLSLLVYTWWLCGYIPVKMELLEGQHIGVETKELLNLTPSSPRYLRVFVMVDMEPEIHKHESISQ